MRESVSSNSLVTHTLPALSTATPVGPDPTVTVLIKAPSFAMCPTVLNVSPRLFFLSE